MESNSISTTDVDIMTLVSKYKKNTKRITPLLTPSTPNHKATPPHRDHGSPRVSAFEFPAARSPKTN